MIRQDFDFPGLEIVFSKKPLDLRAKSQGQKVASSMEKVLEQMKTEAKQIYSCNQIHSNKIFKATSLDQGEDFYYGRIFRDGDGIITNLSQVALVCKVADCVPILLYDPHQKVQASLHSGWRGTLERIGPKGMDIMEREYGSQRKDIHAFIGPSISWDAFEVQEDVSSLWRKNFPFAEEVIKYKDPSHQLIDLKESNKRLLLEAGLKEENIVIAKECTFKDRSYHSYRRDRENHGINAMVTMLIP